MSFFKILGNMGTGRQRSARSSNKRVGGKKLKMEHDVYQQLSLASGGQNFAHHGMRPLSAPKIGNKRAASANNRKRSRVQSGKVKQIKQYLSEQEAANM